MARSPHTARLLALSLAAGCGGKEGEEVAVNQTPVLSDSDTAATDTGDTGDTGDTADTGEEPLPTGPFWLRVTLEGGDPAAAFEARTLTVQTGAAVLSEDDTGFVLSTRFEGVSDGTALVAPCTVPFSFTGGLPAENAETSRDGLDVGCPKLTIDSVLYAENLNGLTLVTVNDGSSLEGTFTLDARSAAGHLLVGEGQFHAELCDGFWDGTACSY